MSPGNVGISINIERPHIFIKDINVKNFPDTPPLDVPLINFKIRNYGRTPAKITGISVEVQCLERLPEVATYDLRALQRGFTIVDANGESRGFERTFFDELTDDDRDAIDAGEKQILVYGFCQYSDVFDYSYVYGFCLRYENTIRGFIIAGNDTYNYQKKQT